MAAAAIQPRSLHLIPRDAAFMRGARSLPASRVIPLSCVSCSRIPHTEAPPSSFALRADSRRSPSRGAARVPQRASAKGSRTDSSSSRDNGGAASVRFGMSERPANETSNGAPAVAGSALETSPDGAATLAGTAAQQNVDECAAALKALGRSAESLPADLADAISRGRVPGAVVERFAGMENAAVMGYLMRFAGFKERLLADDLFLTKVAIECGIGICTKTTAEWERRRGMFFTEIDFVVADIIMALLADFMLVWLPAPTIPLHGPATQQANALQRFLDSCPDNAFQVPLRGTEYTLLQRSCAILRNGVKLMVVGTTASLFGTGLTNLLITVRKVMQETLPADVAADAAAAAAAAVASVPLDFTTSIPLGTDGSLDALASAAAAAADVAAAAAGAVPAELEVPILATSLAYGSYMAISCNLRYQVLAGVVEQRFLEPRFHDNKTLLAVLSFVFRTSNTFIGSLLWVDYARWIGVQ